jgi:NAD(P)-dependent dehydrogenase (short-subunit alcohol dehydrogenase family)
VQNDAGIKAGAARRPRATPGSGMIPRHTSQQETSMDLQLSGKKALITGASMGIGKAIALSLAREGCDVALCARDKARLDAAADEIRGETGRTVFTISADLTRAADAEAFVRESHRALGRIDILVNNAGSAPGGVIETLSEADWEQALQLKFMGYIRCLRYALPIMVAQGGGRVVNLIGNDGIKESYWEIAPGAANAAGQNMNKALAGQYGRHNVSFVAVNPGPVRTERWDGLVKAMARDMKLTYEQADQLAPRSIPLGRIAEVDEVANLCTYLASPLAFFVNGTMIEIDGGQQKPLMDQLRDR